MFRRQFLRSVLFFLAVTLVSSVSAAVLYNESTAGDLSGSGLAPTSVGALLLGSNQVFGSTGAVAGVTDRDYFTLVVPNGYQLASIRELTGTQSGHLSFIGLEGGPQLTLPATATTAAGLLGWWHYSPADIDTNLLTDMSVPSMGSFGFSSPLHSGTYTLWVQDTSPGTFAYGFDLQVIPEPATAALMLIGLAACAISSRGAKSRRRHLCDTRHLDEITN